jgi:predicted metalloprotease
VKWRRGGKGRIEDRRGAGGGLGGGIPIPMGKAAGGGIGGLIVVLLVVLLSGGLPGGGGGGGFGIDPGTGGLGAAPPGSGESALENAPADDDEQEAFVRFVVGDVEDTWREVFAESGQQYEESTTVLYDDAVQTQGCGNAPSSVGPFYCPADRKVYIDLTFFRELSGRFGAPGDFARAYVIAHEIGHHVQNLLGVSSDVNRQQQEDPDSANELSVRLELQADCLAGIWGHTAFREQLLEEGDLEEGLGAAAAVGDDRLQEQAGRRVDRESWTHGSSEQRTRWFRRGFDTGDPRECDTFAGDL